mmetsp:Transcript_37380/g.81678  ORF Transcript_37380/g.81678 Transcript_37380/m.81678 type:complete len:122 (-) Transcript_37380:37-402(-)
MMMRLMTTVFLGAAALRLREVPVSDVEEEDPFATKSSEEDCPTSIKRMMETSYCKSFQCKSCCSDWCVEECASMKSKFEEDYPDCSCEADPATAQSDRCTDYEDKIREKAKERSQKREVGR